VRARIRKTLLFFSKFQRNEKPCCSPNGESGASRAASHDTKHIPPRTAGTPGDPSGDSAESDSAPDHNSKLPRQLRGAPSDVRALQLPLKIFPIQLIEKPVQIEMVSTGLVAARRTRPRRMRFMRLRVGRRRVLQIRLGESPGGFAPIHARKQQRAAPSRRLEALVARGRRSERKHSSRRRIVRTRLE